jgi:hypothetical protein
MYENGCIFLTGGLEDCFYKWPPHSPNLIPYDFFLRAKKEVNHSELKKHG